MIKTHSCCAVAALLLLLAVIVQPIAAQQPPTTERIRIDVNRLGTGEKARAKITLKNGTKIKGYVSEARDENFVVRDRKTDAPTTIAYADVSKVERNRGHSTARNIAIGVGIGVGAFLAIIAITLAHLD
jgi:hypothetical protein